MQRVKNLCNLAFGWKVTSREHTQRAMTFIVRAKYNLHPDQALSLETAELDAVPEAEEHIAPMRTLLGQGSLSAERYAKDDGERRFGPVYPGDFADFKPSAEIMLRASCHPPADRAGSNSAGSNSAGANSTVKECTVGVELSGGSRQSSWKKQLRVYGPRAWVDSVIGGKRTEPMTLSTTAIDYRHAYGGPDYPLNPAGLGHGMSELPRIEPAGGHDYNKQPITPAGFGPINPQWPQRALLRGKNYDAAWRTERAPFYASDFDWRYFQAAPADQQLAGYLRGDETLRLSNLHPDSPRFTIRLPGVLPRAFVITEEDEVRELAMNLDTLFVDLEEGLLYLTWRGLTEVQREDLTDITFALIATDPLGERRPAAEYEEQLRAFAADPVGLAGKIPDDFDPRADPLDALKPLAAGDKEPADAILDQLLATPGSEAERGLIGDVLHRTLGELDEDAKQALKKSLAQAMDKAKSGGAAGGIAGGRMQLPLRRLLQPMAKHFAALKADGVSNPGIDELDKVLADPELAALDPTTPPDPSDDTPPPPAPGVDWSGRDMSDRDLSGLDLSGANLVACNLSKANLSGTDLSGANMQMAVLDRAVLDGATLSEADLSHARIGYASAREADFSRCVLDMVHFRSVAMPAARFDGAKGDMASFSYCDMTGASCKGVSFMQLRIEDCDLDGADLSEAALIRGFIRGSRAARVMLIRATLSHTSFMDSQLPAADVTRATGTNAIFVNSNLDDAIFDFATLPEAKLMEASAIRARFDAADLRYARFDKANLRQAVMSRCNLLSADLRDTVLTQVSFRHANLYDAKLIGAAGTGIEWTGANVAKLNAERSQVVLP